MRLLRQGFVAERDATSGSVALLRGQMPLQHCGVRAWGFRWPSAADSHPTFAYVVHVTFGLVRGGVRRHGEGRPPGNVRALHRDGSLLLWTLGYTLGRLEVSPTRPRHIAPDGRVAYGALRPEVSSRDVPWPTTGALELSCELLGDPASRLQVRVGRGVVGTVVVRPRCDSREAWRPLVWHDGRLGPTVELTKHD